jgi:membrane protease YdiL (CAAX protease family)
VAHGVVCRWHCGVQRGGDAHARENDGRTPAEPRQSVLLDDCFRVCDGRVRVAAWIAIIFWLVVVAYLVSTGLVFGKNPGSLDAMKAMSPRSAVEIVLWVALSVSAGFCEELVFRGYLQRQFYALTGMAPAAVICQALVFGAAHLYQGVQGAAVIAGYGALFGILAASRNSLRPGMIQHGAQDTFTGLLVSIAIRHKLI